MADNPQSSQQTADPVRGPVLRPGRAADPIPQGGHTGESQVQPASATPAAVQPAAPPQTPEQAPAEPASPDAKAAGEAPSEEQAAQQRADSEQRRLRLMLRQCDRVLLMDFDLLAMPDWPDNYTMAEARRRRDLWLASVVMAAIVFLSGLPGFVPAWVAGSGFGAFVIILLLGLPAVRRIYSSRPSYLDLILKRQQLLHDARRHIAHLEGKDGLVWQCARMADFNPALKNTRFSELKRLSEKRMLARHLNRREHIRLCLIYLLEAEKAYSRVQKAFFEGNQAAIERGWESVAAEPEPRA